MSEKTIGTYISELPMPLRVVAVLLVIALANIIAAIAVIVCAIGKAFAAAAHELNEYLGQELRVFCQSTGDYWASMIHGRNRPQERRDAYVASVMNHTQYESETNHD